jgi:acetylornithine deacetylase/succinyl-diaminopimelate desuccinylase-like protein
MTDAERDSYGPIDFDVSQFKGIVGAKDLVYKSKEEILQHRWRYPSLSIHGVEGAFYGGGCKTVIPRKVVGKFSIRLVPNQTPEEVGKVVIPYIEAEFAKLKSPNKVHVSLAHGGKPWLSSIDHPNYKAAQAAVKRGKF